MQITAVMNYKGGVGKTSVTANLAAELAWQGYHVLLLDMDSQASLTFSFIKPEIWQREFAETKTIKRWFDAIIQHDKSSLESLILQPEPINSELRKSGNGGKLSLIASHLDLINVDLELATQLGGAYLPNIRNNYLKVHRMLAEGLKELGSSEYDIVLIDCPPNFNIVTKNAIVCSKNILIPAKPDYLSTLGIDYLLKNLKKLVEQYNYFSALDEKDEFQKISPEILGVVFTMIDVRNDGPIAALRPFIERTRKLKLFVFTQKLRDNKTVYADAPQYGLPVVLNSYSNTAHQNVVRELELFAKQFIERSELTKK